MAWFVPAKSPSWCFSFSKSFCSNKTVQFLNWRSHCLKWKKMLQEGLSLVLKLLFLQNNWIHSFPQLLNSKPKNSSRISDSKSSILCMQFNLDRRRSPESFLSVEDPRFSGWFCFHIYLLYLSIKVLFSMLSRGWLFSIKTHEFLSELNLNHDGPNLAKMLSV